MFNLFTIFTLLLFCLSSQASDLQKEEETKKFQTNLPSFSYEYLKLHTLGADTIFNFRNSRQKWHLHWHVTGNNNKLKKLEDKYPISRYRYQIELQSFNKTDQVFATYGINIFDRGKKDYINNRTLLFYTFYLTNSSSKFKNCSICYELF